jgi:diaminopimelate decarboxylase
MIDVGNLIDRLFVRRDGELLIGGVAVGEIVSSTGSPVFVYDAGCIRATVQRLRDALPESFEVYYSIKANPNQALLKLLLDLGCGFEIASAGEYHQAIASGCRPERVLFAGPGKTIEELDHVVAHGIGEIHAESIREIDVLARLGTKYDRQLGVAIRVNPGEGALGGAMRMGGQPSQFGIDEEQLDAAIDRVLGHASLDLAGIHLFAGTQILSHETLVRQYRKGFELALATARRAGNPLRTVDFGGGLGVPYYKGESPLDVEAFGRGLADLLDEIGPREELEGTQFIVEPGRFLVGEGGVYVSRVLDTKVSRDKTFVIVDGGMHHHLAASGNLGQVIKRNFPVGVINKLDQTPTSTADVVGPLCTPLDVLARGVELPEIEAGDLIGVFQSGAYARASSPLGFLSHPGPPEVLAEGGRFRLIRRRGTHDSYLADQITTDG